jgi:hypothetical protein
MHQRQHILAAAAAAEEDLTSYYMQWCWLNYIAVAAFSHLR